MPMADVSLKYHEHFLSFRHYTIFFIFETCSHHRWQFKKNALEINKIYPIRLYMIIAQ